MQSGFKLCLSQMAFFWISRSPICSLTVIERGDLYEGLMAQSEDVSLPSSGTLQAAVLGLPSFLAIAPTFQVNSYHNVDTASHGED